jgi:hypothetical protein
MTRDELDINRAAVEVAIAATKTGSWSGAAECCPVPHTDRGRYVGAVVVPHGPLGAVWAAWYAGLAQEAALLTEYVRGLKT